MSVSQFVSSIFVTSFESVFECETVLVEFQNLINLAKKAVLICLHFNKIVQEHFYGTF